MKPALPLLRIGILSIALTVSALVHAQDRNCLDMIPKKVSVDGAGNGVYDYSLKWTNGSNIRVLFLGGSTYVRSKVKQYAKVWEQYANVTFQFIESGTADIRISFQQGAGSWSYLGIHSRQMASQGQATMNYGWFNDNTDESEFRRTILHEFGHALGLMHEHKNPLSNIKWNLPVVYNYYQAQGWSISEINEQVINKYSVTLSNRKYDPQSIMHYPVSASLTTDGYSVPWNTNLSTDDIQLIAEMYPKNTTPGGGGGGTGTGTGVASCKLSDIETEHNVSKNNVLGMKIKATFTAYNLLGKKCILATYFYKADGTPLPDGNGRYNTSTGKVASSSYFTPSYQSSQYTKYEVFIPYDELELGDGEHNLKFIVSIWSDENKELIQSGSYTFTFTHGISCGTVDALHTYEDDNERMVIMPKFNIKNAQNVPCKACVYYYYADGSPLMGDNGQQVATCQSFTPAYVNTVYNNGYFSDLYMYMPYDNINIPEGTYDIKFFVALFNGNNQFAKSGWNNTQFTR